MNKKIIALLIGFVLIIGAVTACGRASGKTVAVASIPAISREAADEEPSSEMFGFSNVTEEKETGDGVYGAYMKASDRSKIGTQNEVGVFYDIVYNSLLSGDNLVIAGSMNYKNLRDQDPLFISDDLNHVFKVDDNTVYRLSDGDAGTKVISAATFMNDLKSFIDTGLYLEIEVTDGVVTAASISA